MKTLENIYQILKKANDFGVQGVICIDSGQAGPTLGLTIGTHGNEPSGLALAGFCLEDSWLERHLQKGRVLIVLNNIRAVEAYFQADNLEEKAKARFVDVNYNRLPEDAIDREDSRYELKRFQELYPIYEEFDIGFDIHSTTQKTRPMIIRGDQFSLDLVRGFPIDIIVSNIDRIQQGLPAFAFYGGLNRPIPTMEIEAGSHEELESSQCAIACFEALLKNLNMIKGETVVFSSTYKDYFVCDSLIFPDETYELVKVFTMFEAIKKGQILAQGDGPDLLAQEDAYVLMPPRSKKPAKISDEVFFIARLV